jgi:hypothetical protein
MYNNFCISQAHVAKIFIAQRRKDAEKSFKIFAPLSVSARNILPGILCHMVLTINV